MRSINPHLKNRKRKVFKRRSPKRNMGKRRRSYGRVKRYAKRTSFGVLGIVLGVAGYVVFDAIIKPMLPISGMILMVAEVGLGFWLMGSRKPFLKTLGIAAIVLNVFALLKNIAPSIPILNQLNI